MRMRHRCAARRPLLARLPTLMLVDTVRYKGEAAGGRPLAGIVAMFGAGASIADAASTEGGGKRPHASRPTGACPSVF